MSDKRKDQANFATLTARVAELEAELARLNTARTARQDREQDAERLREKVKELEELVERAKRGVALGPMLREERNTWLADAARAMGGTTQATPDPQRARLERIAEAAREYVEVVTAGYDAGTGHEAYAKLEDAVRGKP